MGRGNGTVVEAPQASARCSSEQWLRKCCEKQQANASPELLQIAKQRAERSARVSKMRKKASKLQKSNMVCQRSWNTSVREMAVDRSLAIESADRASARMESVQRIAAESDSDSEGEAELDMLSAQMGVAAEAPIEVAEAEGQREMQELLEQLKIEPTEDQEVMAKFGLYEKYLETVEKMRGETFGFWGEVKDDFHTTGQAEVERALKKIDSAENMGVEFHPARWFVHDMTAKAGSNSAIIGRVLAMIKMKLELLERTDECPVCLDALDACGEDPHVFSCCHKVCGDCWQHWNELHNGRAFCPLCRNEEFLGDMMRRASALDA